MISRKEGRKDTKEGRIHQGRNTTGKKGKKEHKKEGRRRKERRNKRRKEGKAGRKGTYNVIARTLL